jgi:hypothetical protein
MDDDLNGSVGSIADLKPKSPGFETRVSEGFFLMYKRLRTLVWQTDLVKEANLSRNPERDGPN